MTNLKQALPHLLMATVAIIAIVVLALDKLIPGGEAFGGVMAASGFTLGVTGVSGSISNIVAPPAQASVSAPTSEPAKAPASDPSPAPPLTGV